MIPMFPGMVRTYKRKWGPTRSLLAWEGGGDDPWEDVLRGTSTWEHTPEGWVCKTASVLLRWMVGYQDKEKAKEELAKRGLRWQWLPAPAKVKR